MKNLLLGVVSLLACGTGTPTEPKEINGKPFAEVNVHDFKMKALDGKEIDLSVYKGKVLIIVNTASKCGLTPQYAELEKYYEENKARGIEILGFPANNFMKQEPGTSKEIGEFCQKNYGVTFQMFEKISVKGKDMDPLYQYLTKTTKKDVSWNFQKFLVGKDGNVICSFGPSTHITEAEVTSAIDAALK